MKQMADERVHLRMQVVRELFGLEETSPASDAGAAAGGRPAAAAAGQRLLMRIGSRGSALALAQAGFVRRCWAARTPASRSSRSRRAATAGALLGDKSRWVKELEAALLAGEVDAAVHSAKDVPTELPDGLALAAVPERVDPRDALCGAASLEELPRRARASARAACGGGRAARAARRTSTWSRCTATSTRACASSQEGELDRRDRAGAGRARAARAASARPAACWTELVPAPGQGTLVVEARADDAATRERARRDRRSARRRLPRGRARAGARARRLAATRRSARTRCWRDDGAMTLRAFLGLPDGSVWLRDELTDPLGASPERLGVEIGGADARGRRRRAARRLRRARGRRAAAGLDARGDASCERRRARRRPPGRRRARRSRPADRTRAWS